MTHMVWQERQRLATELRSLADRIESGDGDAVSIEQSLDRRGYQRTDGPKVWFRGPVMAETWTVLVRWEHGREERSE